MFSKKVIKEISKSALAIEKATLATNMFTNAVNKLKESNEEANEVVSVNQTVMEELKIESDFMGQLISDNTIIINNIKQLLGSNSSKDANK